MERKARLEGGFASMRPIVSLSLFYVLFLSMESLLDERVAAFLPPDAVAFAMRRWPGALPTARKSPAPLAARMPRASWSSAC